MSKISEMLVKQAEDLRIYVDQLEAKEAPSEADLVKKAAIDYLVEQGVEAGMAAKLVKKGIK